MNTENWFYSSTNLTSWGGTELGLETLTLSGNSVTRGVNLPQQLFRRAQAQYPTSLYVPSNVFNKTLTLVFDGGNGTITYTLNALGTGTYTWSVGGPGTVVGFN